MGRRWLAYWLVSLCGGGGLILLGTFVVRDRPEWSNGLVALGCLVAAIATAWTLVLPILAAVLLGLTLLRLKVQGKRVPF